MARTTFTPMLAEDSTPERLRALLGETWLAVSVKLDGIRGIVRDGQLVSRKLKPIPNAHIRSLLSRPQFDGFDGELIAEPAYGPGVMQRTYSAVMTQYGHSVVTYYVFDDVTMRAEDSFADRMIKLTQRIPPSGIPLEEGSRIVLVPQLRISSFEELLIAEEKVLLEGYEGLIVRDPRSRYKYGRSTLREGYMLKVKQFVDAEARIDDFEERYTNENTQTRDERGYAKRSKVSDGLAPTDTLGALIGRDLKTDMVVRLGTGLDDALRQEIWDNRPKYKGRIAKYKYQLVGTVDRPRNPVFMGWRSPIDL